MFSFNMINGPAGFDPLIIMLIALGVEAYLGEARFIFRFVKHPVVIIGDMIDLLDRKLNREARSDMDRAIRGFVTVMIVCGLCLVIGYAIAWVGRNHPWGWIIECVLVISLIAQRSLYNAVKKVGTALRDDSLESARDAVSHVVGRDPALLDGHGVARASIESLAENFGDGVVAPVFWYVLFGFPGLLVYKAINTMDSMIGHKSPKYRAFGFSAARIDDIVNIVPARLAALFLCLAALFAPKANALKSLKVMMRDAGKHRSPNAGWPEGAMAGALSLALAGPRRYTDLVVKDPWVGDGSAKATHADIGRALYLYFVACLINAGWVAALLVIRLNLLP
jgi:adenosylcobinamide-phosphate synthase